MRSDVAPDSRRQAPGSPPSAAPRHEQPAAFKLGSPAFGPNEPELDDVDVTTTLTTTLTFAARDGGSCGGGRGRWSRKLYFTEYSRARVVEVGWSARTGRLIVLRRIALALPAGLDPDGCCSTVFWIWA